MHLFQSRPPSHLPLNFFTGIIQRPLTFTRFKAKLLISLLPSEPTSFHSLALKDGSRFFPIQSEMQGPLWQSYIHSVSPIILSPKYLLHLCTSLVTYHHSPSFPSWPPILVRLQQKQLTLKKEPLLTFQMKRTSNAVHFTASPPSSSLITVCTCILDFMINIFLFHDSREPAGLCPPCILSTIVSQYLLRRLVPGTQEDPKIHRSSNPLYKMM